MTVEHSTSPRRGPERRGFAVLTHWGARAILALVLVLGMFGAGGIAAGASKGDRISKGEGEGGESTKEAGVQLQQGKRRPRFEGAAPGRAGRARHGDRAPRTLAPVGVEPPRPTWQRPRRSPPSKGGDDGDGDDELG